MSNAYSYIVGDGFQVLDHDGDLTRESPAVPSSCRSLLYDPTGRPTWRGAVAWGHLLWGVVPCGDWRDIRSPTTRRTYGWGRGIFTGVPTGWPVSIYI